MRTVFSLLAGILLCAFVASAALAETTVEGYSLPDGYEGWGDQLHVSCEPATGKVLSADMFRRMTGDRHDLVEIIRINDQVVGAGVKQVGSGTLKGFSYVLNEDSSWTQYDLTDMSDVLAAYNRGESDRLRWLGVDTNEFIASCMSTMMEIRGFQPSP